MSKFKFLSIITLFAVIFALCLICNISTKSAWTVAIAIVAVLTIIDTIDDGSGEAKRILLSRSFSILHISNDFVGSFSFFIGDRVIFFDYLRPFWPVGITTGNIHTLREKFDKLQKELEDKHD